jgi:Ca-activated chloride channel family protein
MTFYNHNTGEVKYNFVHTMNYKNLPDTLSIDPSIEYDITVHTIPPVTKEGIKLVPGQHNTTVIETPQGSLEFNVPGGVQQWKNLKVTLLNDECSILNYQTLSETEKYIVGSYAIEIPTIPPIKDEIEIEQSKITNYTIPQPGILSVNCMYSGFGGIYRMVNDQLELVYTLDVDNPSESIALLPGDYTLIFRSKNGNRAFYTVEKDFTINAGKSIRISL